MSLTSLILDSISPLAHGLGVGVAPERADLLLEPHCAPSRTGAPSSAGQLQDPGVLRLVHDLEDLS
jgi:hypothetical protein